MPNYLDRKYDGGYADKRPAASDLSNAAGYLLSDMRDALAKWEERAWDGDPRRRDDDEMCKEARNLVSRANEILLDNSQLSCRSEA